MTKLHLSGLSILTGALLALGWPAIGNFSPLLFLAFIPLLFVEHYSSSAKTTFRWYPFLAFLSFNTFTIWWVYCVSEDFATKFFVVLAAIAVNTLMMTFVFSLFHYTKKHLGDRRGYIGLVVYWMAFEYFHLNWELTWPWLSLGNGFANQVTWIQWYEYTGAFGGTLWILLANILIFKILKGAILKGVSFKENRLAWIIVSLVLIVPIVISKVIYNNYTESIDPVKVTIIQPNIDPYNEKYESSGKEQLVKMLKLVDQPDADIDYFLGPETALSGDIQENVLPQTIAVTLIKNFLQQYPEAAFVSGMSSWKMLDNETMTNTARKFENHDAYYDMYNAAIQIELKEESQVYHKSKLVQGVEKMPFANLLKPLENFALDMGGTTGSLGSDGEASVFTSSSNKRKVAPVICYESIYGEFVTSYIQKGASLIFIMTNDGWWGDTPGYRQHLAYARLRAIENRRSIARSANTGISCFINQRGDILESTEWWKEEAITGTLNANEELTVYTRWGNFLARISSFLAVALFVFSFVNSRRSNALSDL